MEWYCSTGQSPQRAVAPTEEEEEADTFYDYNFHKLPDELECTNLCYRFLYYERKVN